MAQPRAPRRKGGGPSLLSADEDADSTQQTLQQVIDKTYKDKLREFKRALTPELLAELQSSLPVDQLQPLQEMLDEMRDLPEDDGGSEGVTLTQEEQQVIEQFSHSLDLPEDFSSYLADMVADSDTSADLQRLLMELSAPHLEELETLYAEMRNLEQLPAEQVPEKYAELSRRMEALSLQMQVKDVDVRKRSTQQQQRAAANKAPWLQQQSKAPAPAGKKRSAIKYGPPAPPRTGPARTNKRAGLG